MHVCVCVSKCLYRHSAYAIVVDGKVSVPQYEKKKNQICENVLKDTMQIMAKASEGSQNVYVSLY